MHRIAYLTSSYARAGDTFIRREVEELRRRGWTVDTYSIRRSAESEHTSEDILREQRSTDYILERGALKLLAAFGRMSLRCPVRMLRAVRQADAIRWDGLKSCVWHGIYLLEAAYLAEQLVDRHVELLHNHISMNSATVALLASTLSGIPFSMTVHGPHDFLAADQWGLGTKIASSSATICISDFGKSQCMLFSAPEHWDKIHVVRCGLDSAFFDVPASPPPDEPRLLCVGRLSPEKGQILLVRAAAKLRDSGVPVEIWLVGDGPSRRDIEREARELDVQDRIRLLGWRSATDIRHLILQCKAVALPSFAEGIPVVLMEGMALRRPVIATRVGGVPELVRPGENGWIVSAGSLDELSHAIREALCAPASDLARMGERGRDQVIARHHLAVETARLSDLFEVLLTGCSPGAART